MLNGSGIGTLLGAASAESAAFLCWLSNEDGGFRQLLVYGSGKRLIEIQCCLTVKTVAVLLVQRSEGSWMVIGFL
jgi:hypothetical protein